MAELPTYNRAGIGYADLPRLSVANLEVGAKGWSNLNEKLDRLGSFAQGKGEAQAIEDAKR